MAAEKIIKVGIIGGSGLENPEIFHNAKSISVDTPFGKPSSDLLEGVINGVSCVLISRHGRNHNITPSKVNYRANIWAMKEIGCTHVIVSSACGSLREEIAPGDIVIPDSFVDMTKKRELTFFNNEGPFADKVVHIPSEPAFSDDLRRVLIEAAACRGIPVCKTGTAVVIEGPRFSSIAESRIYRSWGAHLVNMTLVPEVTLAKELGLFYACVALATDYDCWHETATKVNVADVVRVFQENVKKVLDIFTCAIGMIPKRDWDYEALQKSVQEGTQSV